MDVRLEPGVTLSGHILSEEIGRGGYARVFRAVRGDGLSVAVKVVLDRSHAEALRVEGEALRRLEGPHFVKVIEEHTDEDPPYVVLEHCPGGDLRRLLDRQPKKRLDPLRALELFEEICEGVAAAHALGLVHGDLKPENILLDSEGEPRIADFAFARSVERPGSVERSLATGDGRVRGTYDYMSPEVQRGEPASRASDVFALGVILYELLTGIRPLGHFEPASKLLFRDRVFISEHLDPALAAALAPDPRARLGDASAFLSRLSQPPPPLEPTKKQEEEPPFTLELCVAMTAFFLAYAPCFRLGTSVEPGQHGLWLLPALIGVVVAQTLNARFPEPSQLLRGSKKARP